MKKLILFGGTFDPPHNEHIASLIAAKEETGAEKVIVMPDFIPPHKQTAYNATAEERFEMCRLAFGDFAEVCDMEIAAQGKSYSYITVEKLKKLYPDYQILFLMGGDMLRSFDKWKYPERILSAATLLFCERTGENQSREQILGDFKSKFGVEARALSYVGKETSSGEIKYRYLLGLPIDGLTKKGVADYIIERSPYKSDAVFEFAKANEKPSRLVHTVGTILLSEKLARRDGVDVRKAVLAAAAHDIAKYLSPSDFAGAEIPLGTPEPVVHQYLGAYILERVLGVKDEEMLDAVRYHTTGKKNMSRLGKILFVADMAERGRDFDGVEDIRKALAEDTEKGFAAALKATARHLLQSGKSLGLTAEALEFYGVNPEDNTEE